MSKILTVLVALMMYAFCFGQEGTYSGVFDELKRLIVVQSLMAENRIVELSEFLDQNFVANDEGTLVSYSVLNNEEGPVFAFSIEEGAKSKYIKAFVMTKDNEGKPTGMDYNAKGMLLQSITNYFQNPGLPIKMFNEFRKSSIELANQNDEVVYVEKGAYSFELVNLKNQDDNQLVRASNYRFLENSSAVDILFSGPGEWYIRLVFPNNLSRSEVNPYAFLISAVDRTGITKPINTKFFMSLSDFNDRIWLDN